MVELGDERGSIKLQSLGGGKASLHLVGGRDAPGVVVQNDPELGSGIVITKPDGTRALTIGVSALGEVRNSWQNENDKR